MENKKNNDSFINVRSFIGALIVIAALMVGAYVLTLVIPCGGIEFWRWLLSPVLLLGADGSATIIAVIIFLLVIGGIFNALDKEGVMLYMLNRITDRYGDRKYKLMAVVMFFFMALGSLIGSFEECVPMVPIVVALAVRLGWDNLTGMAMSLLSVGCGFAAGVFNPFTIGVAQKLAGLPMFSGAWYRAINFVCIFVLLFLFTRSHAKKIDSGVKHEKDGSFERNKKKDTAVWLFGGIMGLGIVIVLSSALITALQDYTMIIIAVMFLIAGIVATLVSGAGLKKLLKNFGSGALSMVPAVFMILMASSIKYILQEAGTLDTILHGVIAMATKVPSWAVIIFIYLVVLLMNFFVASGSAKAFMIMPLIVPLAQVFGIPAQLCVMAYAFGDGFSNVFYPTNPALLVGLNLSGIGYGKWAKFSWKFQLLNLLLTSLLLMVGIWIGYC